MPARSTNGLLTTGLPLVATSESVSPLIAGSNSSTSSTQERDDTYPLSEHIENYPFYHGRRHHSYREGSYDFPNDQQEQERMNLQFCIIKAAQDDRLFFAPVRDPKRILDVGTGTGIWCIAVADSDEWPEVEITGIDLSPIQPRDVPVNVHFEVQDCTDADWARPLGSIDLVYCQSLFGSLVDYQQLLITARKYITPGSGWVECCELDIMPFSDDNTMPEDYSYKTWVELISKASVINCKPFRIASKLKDWMVEAGYVDVHEMVQKIPLGAWPKRKHLKMVGRDWLDVVSSSISTASVFPFEKAYGWSEEQSQVFCAQAREDLRNRKIHTYTRVYTVYGRRPSREEEKAISKRMAPPPVPPKTKPAGGAGAVNFHLQRISSR